MISRKLSVLAIFAIGWLPVLSTGLQTHAAVHGWLDWRGPQQNGSSAERGLPDKIELNGPNHLFTVDFPGASTPVIANGKLYVMGYLGEGPGLQEGVACFDAETGKKLWDHLFSDFLSDNIYTRYATSSPSIDPETGNVYIQCTQGILAGFTADGELLWQHSMMESYGRLTFPNGRTASPAVQGGLVVTRGITANWGANGPVGDRFYAFDKQTGELVWASTPADRPKDSSFSHPYFGWLNGQPAFVATTGDGSVVCANAGTGTPIWRVPLTKGGINATVLVHNNDTVIAVYGMPYEPGQMVAFKVPKVTATAAGPAVVERSEVEIWSRDISTSTSSPILVGDTIYVVAEKGDLFAVDVKTGDVLWTLKIGIEQRNSCPLYADGKLYVPMLDAFAPMLEGKGKGSEGSPEAGTSGSFYVIQPTRTEGKILSHVALEGRCFGSPTAYNGKVYIQTKEHLYCFGKKGDNPGLPKVAAAPAEQRPGPAAELQIIPSEVLLLPGEKASFRVRKLDAKGLLVEEVKDVSAVEWKSFIPPTAKVRARLNGAFNAKGELVAGNESSPSAGAFEATLDGLKGYIRGRVLSGFPFSEEFEGFKLTETTDNSIEPATAYSYPPLPWIGARFKFEVREREGNQALVKTIENKLFQRGTVFFGREDMKNYTVEADVMSEGNRRKMSEVGLINQRYLIVLKGNDQKLEISSNLERLRVPEMTDPPNFRWRPNVWYHLKTRVDVAADGSGFVRAKAWPKGDPEPEAWTLEVPHANAHQSGSPGLFGFAPQEMRVYIDNVSVTQNH
ncbi:MAG: PQQ-binding-like beta-propeller repeat protein [Verrucomicrobia bacterium]|nr:PQQ-binding-like beta-propeller repeat protein [Verrucomicrobiota bacterium]